MRAHRSTCSPIRRFVATGLAAALVAAGCGGSDSADDGASDTSPPAATEAAATSSPTTAAPTTDVATTTSAAPTTTEPPVAEDVEVVSDDGRLVLTIPQLIGIDPEDITIDSTADGGDIDSGLTVQYELQPSGLQFDPPATARLTVAHPELALDAFVLATAAVGGDDDFEQVGVEARSSATETVAQLEIPHFSSVILWLAGGRATVHSQCASTMVVDEACEVAIFSAEIEDARTDIEFDVPADASGSFRVVDPDVAPDTVLDAEDLNVTRALTCTAESDLVTALVVTISIPVDDMVLLEVGGATESALFPRPAVGTWTHDTDCRETDSIVEELTFSTVLGTNDVEVTAPAVVAPGEVLPVKVCWTDPASGLPVVGGTAFATLGNDPAGPSAQHANGVTGEDGCVALDLDTTGVEPGPTSLWTADGVEAELLGPIEVGGPIRPPGDEPLFGDDVEVVSVDPMLQAVETTVVQDAVGNIFVRICFAEPLTRERLDQLEEWFLSIAAGPSGDTSKVELFWNGEELAFVARRPSGEFAPSARILADGCLLVFTGLASSSDFSGLVVLNASTTEVGGAKQFLDATFAISSDGAVTGSNDGNVNDVFPDYEPLFSGVDE